MKDKVPASLAILNHFKEFKQYEDDNEFDYELLGDVYKEEFDILEKRLKAIEIIKAKGVTVGLIRAYNYARDYNLFTLEGKLTEDEFSILKEVL